MQVYIWKWAGFIFVIVALLLADLGILHRRARVIPFREALLWSLGWFVLAMIFGAVLARWNGSEASLEYVTGYVIELSLSLDNVFAIAVIFAYFGTAPEQQHRVLFWGVMGAIVMRGLIIILGTELIETFGWILFVLGAFLVFTGCKWAFSKQQPVQPEKNRVIALARKILPLSSKNQGQKFWTRIDGRICFTPLALVLIAVELTDLIFAADSIPAVLAVTQKPFIVFSSNILAVLGLRSLYFVLAGAMRSFRFLRFGLAIVLILVGLKMLIAQWYPISVGVSLCVVAGIIGIAIVASIFTGVGNRQKK